MPAPETVRTTVPVRMTMAVPQIITIRRRVRINMQIPKHRLHLVAKHLRKHRGRQPSRARVRVQCPRNTRHRITPRRHRTQIMAHQNRRQPHRLVHATKQLRKPLLTRRIDPRRRLIQNQKPGPRRDRPGNHRPLQLPARQPPDRPIQKRARTRQLNRLIHRPARLSPKPLPRPKPTLHTLPNHLRHAQRKRQLRHRPLRHIPNQTRPARIHRLATKHTHRPRTRPQKPKHNLHQGRLPTTIRPKLTKPLTRRHPQRNILQRKQLIITRRIPRRITKPHALKRHHVPSTINIPASRSAHPPEPTAPGATSSVSAIERASPTYVADQSPSPTGSSVPSAAPVTSATRVADDDGY